MSNCEKKGNIANYGGISIRSIAPFEDAMQPLNKGYYICGGIGLIAGIRWGISAAMFLGLCGMFLWWIVKANIALYKWRKLRCYEFSMDEQLPYEELVVKLIPVLTTYGLRVDRSSDGNPEVSYKNVRVRIIYNENGTFSMPWKQMAGLFFFDHRYIVSYKNTVAAMSILGYHVQQVSSEDGGQEIQNKNQEKKEVMRICRKCGAELSENAKFCRACGTGVAVEPESRNCPKCGAAVSSEAGFCKGCGEKLS